MLNYFVRPDKGRHLHNHPWEQAYSRVLLGWYDEQLLDQVTVRRRAGSKRVFSGRLFHRVSRVSALGALTLFRGIGGRARTWGFDVGGVFVPHYWYTRKEGRGRE